MSGVGLAVLLLVALLIGILIGLWLRARPAASPPPRPPPQPPGPVPPPGPAVPPRRIPDRLEAPAIATALGARLAGAPADGSPSVGGALPQRVIWVDGGDEVLVHLDRTQVQTLDKTLLVSVELETDQTGPQALIVALALGAHDDPAGLVAATDELPRGHGLLAARWGKAVQAAVWEGLLQLAAEHAGERGQAPRGLSVGPDGLRLHAGEPLRAGGAR